MAMRSGAEGRIFFSADANKMAMKAGSPCQTFDGCAGVAAMLQRYKKINK
jgi:hypothetical protein